MEILGEAIEPEYEEEAKSFLRWIDYASQGNIVKIGGIGYSMSPLMVGGRDYAYLERIADYSKLKKGDIVLYISKGIFVLHRIFKKDEQGYWMLGDGNFFYERPISEDRIFLKATTIENYRGGKRRLINLDKPINRFWGLLWTNLWRLRPLIFRVRNYFRESR